MKLNVKAFALAAGILWGAAVFVITLSALWRGAGGHLSLLRGFYCGYQVSYLGSVIGLVYGFATGLLGGALFAWLYNRMVKEA
ncbi:MAG: bacteriophage holin [Bryobacteraceae bacterium]